MTTRQLSETGQLGEELEALAAQRRTHRGPQAWHDRPAPSPPLPTLRTPATSGGDMTTDPTSITREQLIEAFSTLGIDLTDGADMGANQKELWITRWTRDTEGNRTGQRTVTYIPITL